jgi:hypothetical protein
VNLLEDDQLYCATAAVDDHGTLADLHSMLVWFPFEQKY